VTELFQLLMIILMFKDVLLLVKKVNIELEFL